MNCEENKSYLAHITEDRAYIRRLKNILKEQHNRQQNLQKLLDVKNGDIVVECCMILESIRRHFKNI